MREVSFKFDIKKKKKIISKTFLKFKESGFITKRNACVRRAVILIGWNRQLMLDVKYHITLAEPKASNVPKINKNEKKRVFANSNGSGDANKYSFNN